MKNSFNFSYLSQIFLESLESWECWTNWFSSQIEFLFTHQSFYGSSSLSLSLNYLELKNIFHLTLQEYFYFDQDDLEKKNSPLAPWDRLMNHWNVATCFHYLLAISFSTEKKFWGLHDFLCDKKVRYKIYGLLVFCTLS